MAFERIGHGPRLVEVPGSGVLLVSATLLHYSLWILIVSAAFFVVKVDKLTYRVDAAHWPSSVFPKVVRWVFTFVSPLALMTTFPAEAMLGRLAPQSLLGALLGTAVFARRRGWCG